MFLFLFIVRFSPEVLGLCASTALVWIVIEVLALLLSLYLLTVHTDLSTFDLIAYSGYKYVGYVSVIYVCKSCVCNQVLYFYAACFLFVFRMIFTLLSGLLFGSDGYYVAFGWSSCALMFFIVSIIHFFNLL